MHCATCLKNFPAKESKCPNCQAWLLPGKTKGTVRATVGVSSPAPSETVPAPTNSLASSSTSSWGSWTASSADGWGKSSTSVDPMTSEQEGGWGMPRGESANWGEVTPVDSDPTPVGRGWLIDEDSALPTRTALENQTQISEPEDWVDEVWDSESMDEYPQDFEDHLKRDGRRDESPNFLGIIVILIGTLWLGAYLWTRPQNQALDLEAEKLAEISQNLNQGRAYFQAAQTEYNRKSYESASSQLKAATKALVAGEASKAELDEAYLLLAKASFEADQLLLSRDLWFQLGENIPELREEAEKRIQMADEALVSRGENLLKQAYQELQQKRDNASRAKAAEALDLFLDFGGTDQQVGRGYAALARADLQKGVSINALRFFELAKKYDKQGNYDASISALRSTGLGAVTSSKVDVPRDNRRPGQTKIIYQPSFDSGARVPKANPSSNRPRPVKNSNNNSPVQTTSHTQTRMKEIPAYVQRNQNRRSQQNSSKSTEFVNYQDRTRK